MFRDTRQRWLVIKTLLGALGLSQWVIGDEAVADEDGLGLAFSFDDEDMSRAYSATLLPPEGYSSRETFLRLAMSLNTNRIAVPVFAAINALDYPNRAFVMGLLVAMFGDGSNEGVPRREAIDAWLAKYAHLRTRTRGVQSLG